MSQTSQIYDVGVVGAGVMGSSTAYFLTKSNSNLKILLLEQFDLLHRLGSSHGDSRIIRKTYSQEHFTKLMITKAYPLWTAVEQEAGTKVFTKTGGVDFGRENNPELQNLIRVANKYGVGVEVLNPSEMTRRYPLITLPSGWIGVYSPSSGILNATKAVSVFQSLARKRGAILQDNARVVKVTRDQFCYELVTHTGQVFRARKVIFTTGPWTRKLLQEQFGPRIDLPLTVEQTTIAYWRVEPDLAQKYHSSAFPVFINYEDPLIYGTPAHEYPGLIKAAVHAGKNVDPDNRDFEPGLTALREKVGPFLTQFFQGVDPIPVRTESCLYTWTPDENFIIDEIPGSDGRLFVGCGFSGHGFKLAPAVGEMLAEMVVKGKGKVNILGNGETFFYSEITPEEEWLSKIFL